MDISNGEGLGVSLFVQGCDFHCKNCFNNETWDFNKGKEFTPAVFVELLKYLGNPHVKRFTILGGEPFHLRNRWDVLRICEVVKDIYPEIKIWVYTGYTMEELGLCSDSEPIDPFWAELSREYREMQMLKDIDVIVDGRYIDELQDFNYKWAGSTNQRVIDVPNSIQYEEIVLYEKNS